MRKSNNIAHMMVEIFKNDKTMLNRLITEDTIFILEKVQTLAEQKKLHDDLYIFRIALVVLGLLTLISAIGSIILVSVGKTTPESLIALGSAAVGALVGLFATPIK